MKVTYFERARVLRRLLAKHQPAPGEVRVAPVPVRVPSAPRVIGPGEVVVVELPDGSWLPSERISG